MWPWPKNQEPGSLFFSTKPIPRIHGAQTYIGSHMVRSQTRSRVRRIDQWLLEWQYKSKMGILKQNKFTCWKKLWTKTLPEFGKVKPAQLNFGFVQCMGAARGTCKIWAPGTQLIKTSPAQTNSSQSWKKTVQIPWGVVFKFPACMHGSHHFPQSIRNRNCSLELWRMLETALRSACLWSETRCLRSQTMQPSSLFPMWK